MGEQAKDKRKRERMRDMPWSKRDKAWEDSQGRKGKKNIENRRKRRKKEN